MQWYYSKHNTQLGPVGQDELLARIGSGEVGLTDLVWREGMVDWKPCGQVAELRELVESGRVARPPVPFERPVPPPPMVAGAWQVMPLVPNYLWQAIVVTLFCCWPLGIPAIVYAAKVDSLRLSGDLAGAMAASASARNWCLVAFFLGLVANFGFLIFLLVAGLAG